MVIELTLEDGSKFSVEASAIRSFGIGEINGKKHNYVLLDDKKYVYCIESLDEINRLKNGNT